MSSPRADNPGDAPPPSVDPDMDCAFDPADALAWSEARVDAGVDAWTVAVWTPSRPTVAVGLSQDIDREVDRDACRRDGVALVRRASGGGAVWLGPGVLCWEAFRPPPPPGAPMAVRDDYRRLSLPVVDACQDAFGVRLTMAGICDWTVDSTREGEGRRKIIGLAQLRRRGGVLVHGSLLVDADVSRWSRYLRMPSEVPDYRASRPHGAFCATLAEAAGRAVTVREVVGTIARAIAGGRAVAAGEGRGEASSACWQWATIPATPSPAARALRERKYAHDDWTERRRPAAASPDTGA